MLMQTALFKIQGAFTQESNNLRRSYFSNNLGKTAGINRRIGDETL